MATILSKMHETLKKSRSKRLTALRELQEEEDNPFKILIGTIISARTRDENSKVAVRRLFTKFRDPEALASASIDEIAELIKEAGFYRIKAKRIKEVAKIIHEKYNDEVPSNIDELLELPGVGRKTANCVLVYAFDKDAIPVDTHVHRIANRLGLVNTKEPEETEEELKKIIDRKYWKSINDTFVMFGQNVCKPTKPLCNECLLKDYCKYFNAS
ncbi:MAG: endonuclease III [Candidatus Nitrosothermus koennekii]|nr:MAG: endonuclease III [Candidatus Nitrosothermus koennekii]